MLKPKNRRNFPRLQIDAEFEAHVASQLRRGYKCEEFRNTVSFYETAGRHAASAYPVLAHVDPTLLLRAINQSKEKEDMSGNIVG